MDIVDKKTRSRMMSGIKGTNTKPELTIRSRLHKLGYRFRLHAADLPGKPDLLLPKYRAAIFIHGCFWHKHLCHLFKMPSTRRDFWEKKIGQNEMRDLKNNNALIKAGWRVGIVWECSIRGAGKDMNQVCNTISRWLTSQRIFLDISGSITSVVNNNLD